MERAGAPAVHPDAVEALTATAEVRSGTGSCATLLPGGVAAAGRQRKGVGTTFASIGSATASREGGAAEATMRTALSIGDLVEFELGRGVDGRIDGRPRWNHDRDRGATGQWCQGVVSGWTPSSELLVDFLNPVTGWSECWSFPGSGFSEERPGWVRAHVQPSPACECGALKVWGRGPHSPWCPMHQAEAAPAFARDRAG